MWLTVPKNRTGPAPVVIWATATPATSSTPVLRRFLRPLRRSHHRHGEREPRRRPGPADKELGKALFQNKGYGPLRRHRQQPPRLRPERRRHQARAPTSGPPTSAHPRRGTAVRGGLPGAGRCCAVSTASSGPSTTATATAPGLGRRLRRRRHRRRVATRPSTSPAAPWGAS